MCLRIQFGIHFRSGFYIVSRKIKIFVTYNRGAFTLVMNISLQTLAIANLRQLRNNGIRFSQLCYKITKLRFYSSFSSSQSLTNTFVLLRSCTVLEGFTFAIFGIHQFVLPWTLKVLGLFPHFTSFFQNFGTTLLFSLRS